jgi:hypothetical protein
MTMTDDNDEAVLNYYVINDGLRWSSTTCLNNFFFVAGIVFDWRRRYFLQSNTSSLLYI